MRYTWPTWAEPLAFSLQKYALKWRHISAHTNGYMLQQLGLKPGPAYKRILDRLRAARLDGEVRTVEQEKALLERLLREYQ